MIFFCDERGKLAQIRRLESALKPHWFLNCIVAVLTWKFAYFPPLHTFDWTVLWVHAESSVPPSFSAETNWPFIIRKNKSIDCGVGDQSKFVFFVLSQAVYSYVIASNFDNTNYRNMIEVKIFKTLLPMAHPLKDSVEQYLHSDEKYCLWRSFFFVLLCMIGSLGIWNMMGQLLCKRIGLCIVDIENGHFSHVNMAYN